MRYSFNSTLILFLTLLTGFSGLVYEVTWQTYIANLIGSHARSAAIIVSVFLGGLSLGYYYFGSLSQKHTAAQLIKIYGYAEIAIGAWALIFPKFFKMVSLASPLLPSLPDLCGDLLTALVLIGFPTFLMGGTLPLLTQALSRTIKESSQLHARIYALNTAGAFFGCICAGFLLIPKFGLPITMMLMAIINLGAGLCMLFSARKSLVNSNIPISKSHETFESLENSPLSNAQKRVVLLVSLTSGLISITCQMVIIRLIGLSAGSSQYAFSMAVGAFILMLAFGAWRLSAKSAEAISLWKNQTLLVAGLLIILYSVPTWPYACHVIRVLLTTVPPNFYLFHLILFIALTLALLLAVAAMGNTLPTLFRLSQRELQSLGDLVGKLYAINTVGCVLGALIGGYLVLYLIDFYAVVLILTGIAIGMLGLIGWYIEPQHRRSSLCVCILACCALLVIVPWPAERMGIGTFRSKVAQSNSFSGPDAFYQTFVRPDEILGYKDDPNSTVTIRGSLVGQKSIYINGKSDGNTGGADRTTTKMLAHLPLLLQKAEPKRVAVVGFGTGITTGTAAIYPSVSSIDLIEIAHALQKLAPIFDDVNHQASKSSKLNWHTEDAFRFLTRNSEDISKYDTIISEPSNPWVTGVERLYAEEFYTIVRSRLQPTGIYAQWFHTYSMSPATLGLVLNTFHRSWPHVRMFLFQRDLVMLGSASSLDNTIIPWLNKKFATEPVREDLGTLGIKSVSDLARFEVFVPPASFAGAGHQTLEFPKLSYLAGYDFFLDATASLSFFNENLRWLSKTWELERKSILRLLAEDGNERAPIKFLLRHTCNFPNESIPEKWKSLPPECLRLAFAAAFADEIIAYPTDFARDLALIRKAQNTLPNGTTSSLTEAAELTKLLVTYRSSLLPINGEALLSHIQPCLDSSEPVASECRINLAQILTITGDEKRAKQLLETTAKTGLTPQALKARSELVELLSRTL